MTRYDRKGVQNSIPQLWFTIIIKCIILDDVSKSEILVDLTNKIGEKMFTFFVLKYKKKSWNPFSRNKCAKKSAFSQDSVYIWITKINDFEFFFQYNGFKIASEVMNFSQKNLNLA